MDGIELEMKFLDGKPVNIPYNLSIHKVSFDQISDIGYLKYNQVINMLCLDEEKIKPYVIDNTMDVYTFLILNAYSSEQNRKDIDEKTMMDDLLLVLSYIFNEKVEFNEDNACFYVGLYGVLFKDNFNEFQTIIKKRNCLENIEEEKDNPSNEMAKRLLEKQKKAREKLAKAKLKESCENGEPLTIVDLISIYAEAEHMKPENVFAYDMYQLNDQFNRMRIFRDYRVNIQALLAGAKNEDIKLQHWLGKNKLNN